MKKLLIALLALGTLSAMFLFSTEQSDLSSYETWKQQYRI